MAVEQGPWIDKNPGPRNADWRQKETVCFAGLAKGSGCLSDSTSYINANKPVKVCHIFHADIVKLCQMYSANVSIYTSKFN